MRTVAISILGTVLDKRGNRSKRWDKWRPTVSMFQHDDLMVDRLDLVFDRNAQRLADQVTEDIYHASPDTRVTHHHVNFDDPWDFETVYSELLDFCRSYTFKPGRERYLTHITTGTHVAQICLYLLTEAGYLPGKLLQTSPPRKDSGNAGEYQIIDLDLSKYDQIASRFQKEHKEGRSYLKDGIETNNSKFNAMIEQLEKVSIRSREPILITGPTGAGKSQLAQRVYELRKHRSKLKGKLVAVNCATLRGENAMSALFGHKKGAFTGANADRLGLLREADRGLLFLDEIGELGIDEQAMLLRAIEDKCFIPFGADRETSSDFQLIAGTNRDLAKFAREGKFREDLLARIDLWEYRLPSLRERPEDIEPNIEYELEKFASKSGQLISFNKTARDIYLSFSRSPEALWSANFRDLNASITRMGTLADGGRITADLAKEEIARLREKWKASRLTDANQIESARELLGDARFSQLDLYDQIILAGITDVCRNANSMAEAGRTLFNYSRSAKKSTNDSHRVRQLLEKYGVSFDELN